MRCPATDIVERAIFLLDCYPLSGTEIEYAAICLRACYAMSGTEIAYGAARWWTSLRAQGSSSERLYAFDRAYSRVPSHTCTRIGATSCTEYAHRSCAPAVSDSRAALAWDTAGELT